MPAAIAEHESDDGRPSSLTVGHATMSRLAVHRQTIAVINASSSRAEISSTKQAASRRTYLYMRLEFFQIRKTTYGPLLPAACQMQEPRGRDDKGLIRTCNVRHDENDWSASTMPDDFHEKGVYEFEMV